MRDVLILGVIIAVAIILCRIIFSSPLATSIRETFLVQSHAPTSTECPAGAQMYMYDGAAHCCSGIINTEADSVSASCRIPGGRDATLTFCTLGPRIPRTESAGPASAEVPNCLSLRSGLMAAKGSTLCPSDAPNYVEAAADQGKCCTSPGNSALTDCVDPAGSCAVTVNEPNLFKDATSCQFRRAVQDDGACPKAFGPFTAAGQGAMSALTLYGCTDNGTNCYAESTLQRLKELGYDVTGLTSCSKVGP
jgi:hypothetical protein